LAEIKYIITNLLINILCIYYSIILVNEITQNSRGNKENLQSKTLWKTNIMKACPIDTTFKLLGKRFTILILRDMISLNLSRFNQFLHSIDGINPKTLSIRLKEMEKNDLIYRIVKDGHPIEVEYFLTEKGKAVQPILDQMASFSMKYCSHNIFNKTEENPII
jgi:DNA-binding HxlR family transcriptional regulator